MSVLHQRAYTYLRQRMLTGDLEPQQRVSDYVLSPQIGVSRGPVREAIRQLQSEGLVQSMAGGGARVALLDGKGLAELVDMRAALESMAVRRAVPRLTAEDLKALRAQCDAMRQIALNARQQGQGQAAGPLERGQLDPDVSFHAVFFCRAGNQRLIKLLSDWYLLMHMSMRHHHSRQGPSRLQVLAWIWRDHVRIEQAAARGDADRAAALMSAHIHTYPRRLITNFDHWLQAEAPATDNASQVEQWLLAGMYDSTHHAT